MVKEMERSWSGAGAELERRWSPREQCGGRRQQQSRRGFLMEHKHVYGYQQGISSLSSLQGLQRNPGLKFLIV